MRRQALLLGVAVLLGGAAIAALSMMGLFFWSQESSPPASGRIASAAVAQPVKIVRDPFGVPHVRAANLPDAFLGLGFAHAQDRIWQMDLLRRHARGTLSEVFGTATLPHDRLARTLGLAAAAEREVKALPQADLELLEAYAAGVNQWIQEIRKSRAPLPFEARWLNHEIPDWSVVDTLALVRFRSWALSGTLSASLLLERLKREIGSEYNHFYPRDPTELAPQLIGGLDSVRAVADSWRSGAGLRGPVGSLGFAISGARTRSGLPILANDVHLEFQLPALIYVAHMRAGEFEVAGATWPGIPVFWAGTNRSIAWGQVILHASTSEIYDETLHPDGSDRYDRNGRWLDTEVRTEQVAVRYAPDVEFRVRSTRHGPLLGPVFPDDADVQSYAVQWTGDVARSGVRSLLALQRARDWDAFRTALQHYPAPLATFLFADTKANLGSKVAGRLPERTVLMDGLLPVPGRTRMYDWRGVAAFDDLPEKFGSDLELLIATSQPRHAAFPQDVTWLWHAGSSEERLRTELGRRSLTLEDVVDVQRDRRSSGGRERVRQMMGAAIGKTEQGARIREILLDWDGSTNIDSVGATVYHAFRGRLIERLLKRRLNGNADLAPELAQVEPAPGVLLSRFLERAHDSGELDEVDTALDDTWSWLRVHLSSNPRRWTWGEMHRLRLKHPFERIGGPTVMAAGRWLGRGPFAAPGDADSVWTMYSGELPSEAGVGPVLRYAVDLADPEHARVGLAGGQSGHPGDPLYDDALRDWLGGRARPLWMHDVDVAYHSTGSWELLPEEPETFP